MRFLLALLLVFMMVLLVQELEAFSGGVIALMGLTFCMLPRMQNGQPS
jgi:hypothetical protein